MGSIQVLEARHRGQPPFASSAASTARPSFVSQSRPAGSRWMRPLTIMAVTVVPVMPACSQSVSLATQNSRTRSGMLSAGAASMPVTEQIRRVAELEATVLG